LSRFLPKIFSKFFLKFFRALPIFDANRVHGIRQGRTLNQPTLKLNIKPNTNHQKNTK